MYAHSNYGRLQPHRLQAGSYYGHDTRRRVEEAKTCHTHAKAKQTRIDGMMVNRWLLPKVRSIKVEKDENMRIHKVATMDIEEESGEEHSMQLRKLYSLKKEV